MNISVAIREYETLGDDFINIYTQDEMDDRIRTQYTAKCFHEEFYPLKISYGRTVHRFEYNIPGLSQKECPLFCSRLQNELSQLTSVELKEAFLEVQTDGGFILAVIQEDKGKKVLDKINKMINYCYQLDRAYTRGATIGFFAALPHDSSFSKLPTEITQHVSHFVTREEAASIAKTCYSAAEMARAEENREKRFKQ